MTNTALRQTRKSTGQQIAEQVKKQYPDVYRVPGVGWCGPDWQAAQALEHQLVGRLDATIDAFRQRTGGAQ